jgi:hypothetical protein
MKLLNWRYFSAALALVLALPAFGTPGTLAGAQTLSRTFPETGQAVQGRFLTYWTTHGGLTQQGYPISAEMQEKSDTDGKTYTVQYFERAVFEMHPENKAPNDVLLSLLGVFLYNQKYPNGAPNQKPNNDQGSVLFSQTGKRVGGKFLAYWNSRGGLPQQGYPISDEFQEKSDLDGKTYLVQYFERAVFELHPENAGTQYEVLLSQLGTFRYRARYGQAQATPVPIIPTPVAGCTSNLAPGRWEGPLEWQFNMVADQITGAGALKADLALNVACDGTFVGTGTSTSYSGNAYAGPVKAMTCSATILPIADYTGRVVAMSDGLHLLVDGGTWRQGKIECASLISPSPAQAQDLTGQPLEATDIKVETVSEGKITGSQWLGDPGSEFIREKVREVLPNSNPTITGKGHWELLYHPQNTP